jgi:hypothetical protein
MDQSGIKSRETSCFTIGAPTPFARHKPRDLLLFGMLQGVLKDREFNRNDEVEKPITNVWDELTFDERQSAFHNRMNRLAEVVENGGEYIIEQIHTYTKSGLCI